jgi:hypothetical protein
MPAPPRPATIVSWAERRSVKKSLPSAKVRRNTDDFRRTKTIPAFAGRVRVSVISDPESPIAAESARPVPAIQAGPLRGVMFAPPRVARAVVYELLRELLSRPFLSEREQIALLASQSTQIKLKHISPELYSRPLLATGRPSLLRANIARLSVSNINLGRLWLQ